MTPAEQALAEAARAETARVYGTLCPEPPRATAQADQSVFARPADSFYGPAPTELVTTLIDEIVPKTDRRPGTRLPRREIEQAIASGHTDQLIADLLRIPLVHVTRVHADMDRISA